MKKILTRIFTFEAAHILLNHPKCGRVHGHSYILHISVTGNVNKKSGMIMDFSHLKKFINDEIINKYDHQLLNDVVDFIPTCENLVINMWKDLEVPIFDEFGVKLSKIKLYETADSYFEYYEG